MKNSMLFPLTVTFFVAAMVLIAPNLSQVIKVTPQAQAVQKSESSSPVISDEERLDAITKTTRAAFDTGFIKTFPSDVDAAAWNKALWEFTVDEDSYALKEYRVVDGVMHVPLIYHFSGKEGATYIIVVGTVIQGEVNKYQPEYAIYRQTRQGLLRFGSLTRSTTWEFLPAEKMGATGRWSATEKAEPDTGIQEKTVAAFNPPKKE